MPGAFGSPACDDNHHEETCLRILEILAKFCAIAAGLLLTFITLMTCASLIGRNTTGWTLVGDFELTGVAAGAAIALFLPWAQFTRANIIVDFFTASYRPMRQTWSYMQTRSDSSLQSPRAGILLHLSIPCSR